MHIEISIKTLLTLLLKHTIYRHVDFQSTGVSAIVRHSSEKGLQAILHKGEK
tara:strand:+ start:755 stop:910 length:156 start_codon:yes stop_codon:yes gene_type:complete